MHDRQPAPLLGRSGESPESDRLLTNGWSYGELMGDLKELIGRKIDVLVDEVLVELEPHYQRNVLTRLQVLERVRRLAAETSDSEILRARMESPSARRLTWGEIGSALGISAQAARQRAERQNGRMSWTD